VSETGPLPKVLLEPALTYTGLGQRSPKGVTRPPLVTAQQETPPPPSAHCCCGHCECW
jgi:hypothetical protein